MNLSTKTPAKGIVISLSDISRRNRKTVVEHVVTGCRRIYNLLVDDELEWKAQFGQSPLAVYPGLTAKVLANKYNDLYHDKSIDKNEASKRTNDLAKAGRLLVVSTTIDRNRQEVYSWRTSSPEELKAMEDIGALRDNRAPIDFEKVCLLVDYIMPFRAHEKVLPRIQMTVLRQYFNTLAGKHGRLDVTVEGWLNELVFQGIRRLGMPMVFKYVNMPYGRRKFRDLVIKQILDAGPPKRPGVGDETLKKCDEYRASRVSGLQVRSFA